MAKGLLEVGDIIKTISIGNELKEIIRQHQVIDFMLRAGVGDVVRLEILRNGEIIPVTFNITEEYITEY